MTNKERYKKAFSTLHASEKNSLEVEMMENMKKTRIMKKALAACAAITISFGGLTAAYAADIGGIHEKIYTWFHGARTEMNVTDQGNGNYTYTYTDQNGETHEGGGGGVAIDDNGNEIPLSAEDVLDTTVAVDVEEDAEGNVWLYFYDRQINITSLFNKENICRVAVKNDGDTSYEGDTVYFEVIKYTDKEGNTYSYSTSCEKPVDTNSYTLME